MEIKQNNEIEMEHKDVTFNEYPEGVFILVPQVEEGTSRMVGYKEEFYSATKDFDAKVAQDYAGKTVLYLNGTSRKNIKLEG